MNTSNCLEEAIREIAKELNLPKKYVDKVYKAYWKAVREHISELPLKDNLSEEEFSKLQPNVNIPSIGKLYVTYDKYSRIKELYNKYKELKIQEDAPHKES